MSFRTYIFWNIPVRKTILARRKSWRDEAVGAWTTVPNFQKAGALPPEPQLELSFTYCQIHSTFKAEANARLGQMSQNIQLRQQQVLLGIPGRTFCKRLADCFQCTTYCKITKSALIRKWDSSHGSRKSKAIRCAKKEYRKYEHYLLEKRSQLWPPS